jgi:hypothetical protein
MNSITGKGSASLTLSVLPAEPPRTYLGVAHAMLPGVRILAASSPLPALPLAMISAHTLECGLKAYLSRSGDESQVRKREVQHNLNALWSLAFSQGLNIQEQPPQWVDILSHIHKWPYYLRYSTDVHGIQTPAPEPMVTELATIIDQVQRQL